PSSSDPDGGNGLGADGAPSTDGGAYANDGSTTTTTDAGVDADAAAPHDVRTLPGLRLWLESTQDLTKVSDSSDVVSWRDSSGRWADGGAGTPDGGAHVAYPVPYNGGGALYPAVVANGIAGRTSVSFEEGHMLAITNHSDFDVGTGDFVIAAV